MYAAARRAHHHDVVTCKVGCNQIFVAYRARDACALVATCLVYVYVYNVAIA